MLLLVLGPRRRLFARLIGEHKPNRPLRRLGRRHQFAQRIEDLLELGSCVAAEGVVLHGQRIGLHFKLAQALGQVAVCGRQRSYADESAHDFDVHCDGARTAQNGRQHRHALLGEGIGRGAPAAVAGT